jgi:hypothetical protein
MTLHTFTTPTPSAEPPAPETRTMLCELCGTYVLHVRAACGDWMCGAGHNATALLAADLHASATIGETVRLFAGLTPEKRDHWTALFAETMDAETRKALTQALGRMDF